MKIRTECEQLVTFDYIIDLDPKDFLYCESVRELLEEVEDMHIYNFMPMFSETKNPYIGEVKFLECESLGERIYFHDFIDES